MTVVTQIGGFSPHWITKILLSHDPNGWIVGVMSKRNQTLSKTELANLVSYLVEDYGSAMDQDQFNEAFGLMLEDVPGCECINERQAKALTDRAYLLYLQST